MQTLVILGMLALAQAAPAHTLKFEAGMTRPAATIADMAWLTGTWEGEGLGGTFDEVWTAPAGGAMAGWEEKNAFVTFTLVKRDETGAYFGGFTIKRAGPDALEAYLALRDRVSGVVREEKFSFRRVK